MKNEGLNIQLWKIYLIIILLINLILRLIIYYNTNLFGFSDYESYFEAIDLLGEKEAISLVKGNSLFTISYVGFFFKYFLGNIDYFFWLNCLCGTLSTYLVSLLVYRISGNIMSAFFTLVLLTLYTEFMVFSSVFYTPVIMIFLLSVFITTVYFFFHSYILTREILWLSVLLIVEILSFLFKPELIFFPFFLLLMMIFTSRNKFLLRKNVLLLLTTSAGVLIIITSGLYSKKGNEAIANDFVFFGHTDYGGDGGEGAFIYPENAHRYNNAWQDYRLKNSISDPGMKDRNKFQFNEIKSFIVHHPLKWAKLQFTKFFRTFGIVPESTSFKILYTGPLKDKLWLTSMVVVAPVAVMIILLIIFFDTSLIGSLFHLKTSSDNAQQGFVWVYFLLFLYYVLATTFFGHYQERYRMPVLVLFIIPVLGHFLALGGSCINSSRLTNTIKSILIVLFLLVWAGQANHAIRNKERLSKALDMINAETEY